MPLKLHADVLIVGASLGGVAAALSAAKTGASVLLMSQGEWVGGQLTAQGVCTPDENAWVEMGGCTASYQALRRAIRSYYSEHHCLSSQGAAQQHLNFGSCWVSRISAEPRVAEGILREMLAAHSNLAVYHGCRAVEAVVDDDRILQVLFVGEQHGRMSVRGRMVLDATDLGDLLPLAGAEYRVGAESWHETGEPDAPPEPRPDRIQPFTFPFALELRPRGECHVLPKPQGYERLRALQRYHVLDGAMQGMFVPYGWWDYRRVIAASNFDDPAYPYDVAMINTASNDYRGAPLPGPDQATEAAIQADARRASLGYLYWLQTECPREDTPGVCGYPELRLRADWFGTEDGLAPEPYIRESRRIVAIETVREQDIVVEDKSGKRHQESTRAKLRPDAAGIGHYWLDIHEGASDEEGLFLETRPYQIPLGALIPVRIRNLLPACKNLGGTHLTNGALRLHPVEWNVGEAAGLLAAFCVEHGVEPRDVHDRRGLLDAYQARLLDAGVPLYWWGDLTPAMPIWRAAQWLALKGIWPEERDICFRPDVPVAEDFPYQRPECVTRGELALQLYTELTQR